jgi:transcriptional regulator with XRE-family HTH domain
MMMLFGAQIRAARGLLNMSVAELSDRTGLAVNTIRRAESENGPVKITNANCALLESTFESLGVIFIAPEQFGPGVRLRGPDPLPRQTRRRD